MNVEELKTGDVEPQVASLQVEDRGKVESVKDNRRIVLERICCELVRDAKMGGDELFAIFPKCLPRHPGSYEQLALAGLDCSSVRISSIASSSLAQFPGD